MYVYLRQQVFLIFLFIKISSQCISSFLESDFDYSTVDKRVLQRQKLSRAEAKFAPSVSQNLQKIPEGLYPVALPTLTEAYWRSASESERVDLFCCTAG